MSFLKSFAKLARSRPFFAMSSALVMVAGMLFGANNATADSVWVQSYERTNQSQACAAQPGETPWQASWGTDSSWSPSWEMWANSGNGGWVCTRSITWAQSPVAEGSADVNCDVRLTYSVGDIGPGCGTVFYVDMTRAAGSQFWEVGSDLGTAEWGCQGTDIAGTGTAIGDGATNTATITTGCVTTGIAADIASAYSSGTKYDWFLPSKDELNQLCKFARNQSTSPADKADACDNTDGLRDGFVSGVYWSSTQQNGVDAPWDAERRDFANGDQGVDGKNNNSLRVRPVRAF